MEVVMMKVSELKEYERNPRKNEGAVEYVANSIKEFGFKVPIVVDKENVIVAGHTRLKAAKYLGLKEVPVIVADDLTEEQIKAFRLADNKTAELAHWDWAKLDDEMAELLDLDFDMSGFGFSNFEMDLDDFFEIPEDQEEDEKATPKSVTCPNCGEVVEIG